MNNDKNSQNGSKNEGEGSYTGAKDYDHRTEAFIEKNKAKIPDMAKTAEDALEGPEGAELREAEEVGKSKAKQ